jgi:hypothetical protein
VLETVAVVVGWLALVWWLIRNGRMRSRSASVTFSLQRGFGESDDLAELSGDLTRSESRNS